MRAKNVYNALYLGLNELNKVTGHLFVLRMDGEYMILEDLTLKCVVIQNDCSDVEKFLMSMSRLKECLYYCKNGYSPFMDKEKYYGCMQILHTRFYSSLKNQNYGSK